MNREAQKKVFPEKGIPPIITLTCVIVSQPLGVLAEMPRRGHRRSKPRWRNVTAASFIAQLWMPRQCMMEILSFLLKGIQIEKKKKKVCRQGVCVDIMQ